MNSEQLKALRQSISEEVKERLLSGNFDIMGVFNIGFNDRYDLSICGIGLSISVNNGSYLSLIDCFLQISFSLEESQKIYQHIQTGGIRQCLMFKKQQVENLQKDIQNLNRLMEK